MTYTVCVAPIGYTGVTGTHQTNKVGQVVGTCPPDFALHCLRLRHLPESLRAKDTILYIFQDFIIAA